MRLFRWCVELGDRIEDEKQMRAQNLGNEACIVQIVDNFFCGITQGVHLVRIGQLQNGRKESTFVPIFITQV